MQENRIPFSLSPANVNTSSQWETSSEDSNGVGKHTFISMKSSGDEGEEASTPAWKRERLARTQT